MRIWAAVSQTFAQALDKTALYFWRHNIHYVTPILQHAIVMPTLSQTLDSNTPRPKGDKKSLHFHFSLFHCYLTVVSSLEKGADPEISHVRYCHIKEVFFLTGYVFGFDIYQLSRPKNLIQVAGEKATEGI